MSTSVSTNYRELNADEAEAVARECQNAWMHGDIPARQYEIVKPELHAFRACMPVAPYDALVKSMRNIPMRVLMSRPSLLDVGASSGYYREVIQTAGFRVQYRGVDFSAAFKELAENLYPGIDFDVADARSLPYADDSHDIVLSSAVIMHCREYEQVIRETARVAKHYVIFNRTPITTSPTSYWRKDAYQIPVLEIWFNELELHTLFSQAGLELVHQCNVFWDDRQRFGHRTYLLRKPSLSEREWERA